MTKHKTFTCKRLHLPTGRVTKVTFNASHSVCFLTPNHFAPNRIKKVIANLIDEWNRDQPKTWRYYL